MERLPIQYLNPNFPNLTYLYPNQSEQINIKADEKIKIIFTGWEWDTINSIKKRIPNLKVEEHRDKYGDIFITLNN